MFEEVKKYENKNRAKIEFLAIKDDCLKLISQGLSKQALYNYFKELGKITMTYKTFALYLSPKSTQNKTAIKQTKQEQQQNNLNVPALSPVHPDPQQSTLDEQALPKLEINTPNPKENLGVSKSALDFDNKPDPKEIFGDSDKNTN
ncbi:MAG: TraK family protein [Deltaproteobacteria bacterium]|jgi:hypothetical protein|nr:TraK family protein [Deltaproteobacteria bacterium]